jgi:hypothetical protein
MAKPKLPKAAPKVPSSGALPTSSTQRVRMGDVGFDPRFDSRILEQQKLQDLTTTVEKRPSQDVPELYLPDYEGQAFVTSMSDRTAGGGALVDINGVPLKRPVDLQGGQSYMFENPGQVWASGDTPARAILMQAAAAKALTGKDPLYIPWRMAPTGSDFATMTGETMLSFAESNMSKSDKQLLNKDIKEFIPNWKGIDSPKSIEQFRATPDATRKAIKAMMDKKYRDEGGLNIGEARLSIADPNQLSSPTGYMMNVGRIFADKPLIEQSGHASYPKGVPGEGLGRVKDEKSLFEFYPKTFPEEGRGEKVIRPLLLDPRTAVDEYQKLPDVVQSRGISDPRSPSRDDTRALQMKPYYGILTQELLKKMGFAEGGMVETPAQEAIADTVQNPNAARMLEMDLANLSLMNQQQPRRMAEGGEVSPRLFYEKRPKPSAEVADSVYQPPTVESETERMFGMKPREDRLSILPRYSREQGLVAPQFVYDAAKAITAPSVAAQGYEVAPEEAVNLALNVAGGGLGASTAMRNPTGKGGKDLGMFVGQKSNTWDMDKYEMALKMDKAGIDPSEINRYTGYYKNPSSNIWSQEISDASAVRTKNLPAKAGDVVPLRNVMRHENLFYAYPDLKDIKVTREAGGGASYYGDTNTIAIGKDIKKPEQQLSALIHEAQHAIQMKEKFPRGTNKGEMEQYITPEMAKMNERLGELFYAEKRDPKNQKEFTDLNNQMRKLKKQQKADAHETYMRAEGEAQARATEERRKFSEAQRRAIVPSASFNRPMSQLHQVYANGGSVRMSPEEMLIEMMESKYGRR